MLFFNRQINFFIFSENTGNIFAVYGNKIEKEDFFITKIKLNHDGESKKMKWNFRKIVVAAAVIQIGALCVAAEITSEEKEIIDMIVNTNIKKKNAEAEIHKAIAKLFPLSTVETPESAAFIKQLEEETQKKYPAADEELETKYRAEAEKYYPSYKIGDRITVVFLLHRKPFMVSGPFYRQDPKFVWVGSKKILKAHLSKQHASGFDPKQVKTLRDEFVAKNIHRYHQNKNAHFTALKEKNGRKISALRGDLEAYDKFTAAKKAAIEKYMALIRVRKQTFSAAYQMYAEDKAAAYSMMKKAVREYAGTPEAQNGQKLLAEWEPIIAKEKAEREAAEARFRKHQEWRESVRRRTGHYPCQVCNGSGRGSGGYGRAGSVCSSCEGSGLER